MQAIKTPLVVGDKVWIRTFTVFPIGRVAEIGDWWIRLDNASWIAHAGNFDDFANEGIIQEEVPMANGCYLSLLAIVDMGEWVGKFNGQTMQNPFPNKQPFEIGQKIWIRTASVYNIGEIHDFNEDYVTLINSSWVANTGDFSQFTHSGQAKEINWVDKLIHIMLRSVVDWAPFPE